MKNKFLIIAISAIALSASFTACGNTTAKSSVETVNELQAGEHDASEKENTFEADAKAASGAKKGSVKKLSGSYQIKTADGNTISDTRYVFSKDKLSIFQTGTYSFSDGKITISYGGTETTYDIAETTDGFNLTSGESTLLPLVYMEGADGLEKAENFDGVYSMSNTGYVFHADGTLDIIGSQDCKITKKTVTFAGSEYDWKAKDGTIILSTNGTEVMTLVS